MKSKRGKQGAKRADTNILREMLGGQQTVTSLGVVRKFPGETSHFEFSDENGEREVLVDVELIPSGERVQCRLGFGNDGIYRIPRVNQEVAVLLPYHDSSLIKDPMDFEPIIVGVIDTEAPEELDGDDIVVIKAPKVHIFNSGSPVELATKADVEDLADYIQNTMTLPVTGATAGPIASPTVPVPAGTAVLKAE